MNLGLSMHHPPIIGVFGIFLNKFTIYLLSFKNPKILCAINKLCIIISAMSFGCEVYSVF
jgi:hypothetical protein